MWQHPGELFGWVALLLIVAVFASPIAVLAWSLVDLSTEVWSELWRTRLPGMIRDTAMLLSFVVTGTVILGTGLAWLISAHQFPGRRIIGWLLVTPLAIPGYVGGFVWLNTLTNVVGARNVRSLWLCACVLILSLYPYVYLFARSAFAEQGADTVAAARTLGLRPFGVFWRVVLPAARPSIAAGAALVGMEVLTDIGTVRLFNVSTLADGVMRVWFATGDRGAATEVASALTGIAIVLVAAERLFRRGLRRSRSSAERPLSLRELSPSAVGFALCVSLSTLMIAAVVPLSQLCRWALESFRAGDAVTVAGGVGHHTANTVLLTIVAAALCISLGTFLALVVAHRGRLGRFVGRVSTVGYAMPGPVVAVGVVVLLATIDRRNWLPDGFVLVGSTVGLIFALMVRFFAVGYQGVESSLDRMSRVTIDSARVLGAGPVRTALKVELPAIRFGILAALALLVVDMVKELPMTLLLRPFGVDTLSVWIWQATSESLWSQAAAPALVMVVIGMVSVGFLLIALERGAEVVS